MFQNNFSPAQQKTFFLCIFEGGDVSQRGTPVFLRPPCFPSGEENGFCVARDGGSRPREHWAPPEALVKES